MKNLRKRTIIAIIFVLVIITAFIYFVSAVSSVSPPIKKYLYLGSVDQFVSGIQNYASNHPNVAYKITDTVGNHDNGYANYMTIEIKKQHNIRYRLMFEPDNNKVIKTNVNLILAYDETNETGGYQMKAKGVQTLVNQFNDIVLSH